jgi:hypothetical protein
MEVRDLQPGQIFETLTDAGVPTGDVYRVTSEGRDVGPGGCDHQVKVYKQQEPSWISAGSLCRLMS